MGRDTGFPRKVRDQLDERSGGLCEICGTADATQRHHRRPRGSGGTRRTESNLAANGLMLCYRCHAFVEKEGRQTRVSYVRGYLVHQGDCPARVPVHYRGGQVAFLTDDGQVLFCTHDDRLDLTDPAYGDYTQCVDCDTQFTTDGGPL
ncbi:HNH endonuclease [Rhodococcus jostii]|uniref:HNH endonuclease n=1 Tax=Rhodococcus jostii TaxID=132919 RepID=UPI003624C6E5